MRTGTVSVTVAVGLVWALAAGCGDDDGGDEASGDGDGGEEVNVVISEFTVEPDPESVDAGEVTFVVDGQRIHGNLLPPVPRGATVTVEAEIQGQT